MSESLGDESRPLQPVREGGAKVIESELESTAVTHKTVQMPNDCLSVFPLKCAELDATSGGGSSVCGSSLFIHDGLSNDLIYTPRTQAVAVRHSHTSGYPIASCRVYRRDSAPKATAYSACIATSDHAVTVFGGSEEGFVFSSELSQGFLDFEDEEGGSDACWKHVWSRDAPEELVSICRPSGRCSAATARWASGGALILFGGVGKKWQHPNDLWSLDTRTQQFECLDVGHRRSVVPSVTEHAPLHSPADGAESSASTCTLPTRTRATNQVREQGAKFDGDPRMAAGGRAQASLESQPQPSAAAALLRRSQSSCISQFGASEAPDGRRSACATVLGERYFALFGGKDSDGKRLCTHRIPVYDLESQQWYRVVATGERPPPISSCSAVSIPDVVVRPGHSSMGLADRQLGGSSSPESKHAARVTSSVYRIMRCVVLGGEMEDGGLVDAYVLHLFDTGDEYTGDERPGVGRCGVRSEEQEEEEEEEEGAEVHVLRAHWTRVSLVPRAALDGIDGAVDAGLSEGIDPGRRAEILRSLTSIMWINGEVDGRGRPVSIDPWTSADADADFEKHADCRGRKGAVARWVPGAPDMTPISGLRDDGTRGQKAGTMNSRRLGVVSTGRGRAGRATTRAGILMVGGEVTHPPHFIRDEMRSDPSGTSACRVIMGSSQDIAPSDSGVLGLIPSQPSPSTTAASRMSSYGPRAGGLVGKSAAVVSAAGQPPLHVEVEMDEHGQPMRRQLLHGTSGIAENTVLTSPDFVLWDEAVVCRGLGDWAWSVLHARHLPPESPVLASVLGHLTLAHGVAGMHDIGNGLSKTTRGETDHSDRSRVPISNPYGSSSSTYQEDPNSTDSLDKPAGKRRRT